MLKIPKIPAGKGNEIGNFNLASCFFHAGATLYAAAYDGITKNVRGGIGCPTDEYFHGHFIVAFYNFRHALELIMKELAEALNVSADGHNLGQLWKDLRTHPQVNQEEAVISEALLVLTEYNILKDEQLFRYTQHKKSSIRPLKNYPAIATRSFESLSAAYQGIRHLIQVITEQEHQTSIALTNALATSELCENTIKNT